MAAGPRLPARPTARGDRSGHTNIQKERMGTMRAQRPRVFPWLVAVLTALLASITIAGVAARQPQGPPVPVDKDDLGGIVTSAKGPEAGVWVIAETSDLPTKLAKIVVTDDRGRYLIPDMPMVKYSVWVRGYGLVDSPKVPASPGTTLNLNAVMAPDAKAAAHYYPAGYWFSMVKVPATSEFPGTGPSGNGISPNIKTQADWVRTLKSGTCMACHQLGNEATRTIPAALGSFSSSAQAWERRLQLGQAGLNMIPGLRSLGRGP